MIDIIVATARTKVALVLMGVAAEETVLLLDGDAAVSPKSVSVNKSTRWIFNRVLSKQSSVENETSSGCLNLIWIGFVTIILSSSSYREHYFV